MTTTKSTTKSSSKTKKHPGFQSAAAKIASNEKIPLKNAKAILASSARKAGSAAKAANPRLKKVTGKKK